MNGIVENETTENIDKNSMTNDVTAVRSPVSHPVQYLRCHGPAINDLPSCAVVCNWKWNLTLCTPQILERKIDLK